jgi:phage tail sheath protein FI
LDTVPVQLVAVPDAHRFPNDRTRVTRHAIDYCAARGDCVFVGSAPDKETTESPGQYADSVRSYAAQFQADKVSGAMYAPWVTVADPAGTGPAPIRSVPPDGHVLGVYARTEQERGIFTAPAGTVLGALTAAVSFSDDQHDDLVRLGRVNGIRTTRGGTPFVAASRTLSTDARWRLVGTRLLFNFVKATLRDGLWFVHREPHSEKLRRAVRLDVITPFLLGLWRRGAFGSGSPGQVFAVKCDAENNPPSEVARGDFRVEVTFYPAGPAETVRIVACRQPTGGTAAEL